MKRPNWHEHVFFGLHFDLHAREDDTELGKSLTTEHLIEQLNKIKPDFVQCDCKGHPGYTSYPTKVGAASPGIVKDAVQIWREATRQMNIPLGMHYSGVWDTAAIKQHPEWGRVNAPETESNHWPKRELNELGRDKNMTCPKSAYTDDYMIPQMLEIIENYDVDGFWVDGENWASAPCYCEDCRDSFKQQYGDVELPEKPEDPLWQEWLAYNRDHFVDHVRRYANAVHDKKPGCTVCSNWMYTVRQPEPIQAPIDYISGDFNWVWSAEKASVEARFMDSRKISWDLMAWAFSSHGNMQDWVFKSADALCQEAAVVMSCGGSFMIYDTPNRDGTLVDWHMNELAKVAAFCRARQPYSQYTTSVPQVVLLHAKEHYYSQNDPLYNLAKATDPLEGALHVLLENSLPVDILNSEDLFEQIDQYPVCVVGEQDQLSQQMIECLKQYVQHGGHLIVSGARQTEKFDDLLGVASLQQDQADQAADQSYFIPAGNGSVCTMGQWRLVKATDDRTKVFAPLLLSRDIGSLAKASGGAAATIRQVGKGKIAGIYGPVFGTYAYSHYPAVRSFISEIIEKMDHPLLIKNDAPANIQFAIRQKEHQLMIHLVNMSVDQPLSPRKTLVEKIPASGPVTIKLPLEKSPRFISLQPSAQPLDWTYADGVLAVQVKQIQIHDIIVIER